MGIERVERGPGGWKGVLWMGWAGLDLHAVLEVVDLVYACDFGLVEVLCCVCQFGAHAKSEVRSWGWKREDERFVA